jgi:hypothetical protein
MIHRQNTRIIFFGVYTSHEAHTGLSVQPHNTLVSGTSMFHRQKQTRIIFSGINKHTRHIQVYHPNHIKHLLRAQAPSTGKTHESCYFRYTQSHEAHTGLSVKPHQTLVLGTDMFQRQKQRRIIFLPYKQAHEAQTGLSPKPHKTLVSSTGTIHRQNTRVMLF